MALDAANFDKPTITVGYDGKEKLDYWHSIINNYDKDHFKHVIDTGAVRIAHSEDEMVNFLDMYLKNPDIDKDNRKKLRESMLYRCDGNSAKRVADEVLKML